jgi:quercetin dioxygenase-like cupin family protein
MTLGRDEGTTPVQRRHLLTGAFGTHVDRIEAHRVVLTPGQRTGPHHHAGGVAGYVEWGEIVFAVEGRPPVSLHAGDVFFEPPGAPIARFDNASTAEPARFVAFYALSGDQTLITMHRSDP